MMVDALCGPGVLVKERLAELLDVYVRFFHLSRGGADGVGFRFLEEAARDPELGFITGIAVYLFEIKLRFVLPTIFF